MFPHLFPFLTNRIRKEQQLSRHKGTFLGEALWFNPPGLIPSAPAGPSWHISCQTKKPEHNLLEDLWLKPWPFHRQSYAQGNEPSSSSPRKHPAACCSWTRVEAGSVVKVEVSKTLPGDESQESGPIDWYQPRMVSTPVTCWHLQLLWPELASVGEIPLQSQNVASPLWLLFSLHSSCLQWLFNAYTDLQITNDK